LRASETILRVQGRGKEYQGSNRLDAYMFLFSPIPNNHPLMTIIRLPNSTPCPITKATHSLSVHGDYQKTGVWIVDTVDPPLVGDQARIGIYEHPKMTTVPDVNRTTVPTAIITSPVGTTLSLLAENLRRIHHLYHANLMIANGRWSGVLRLVLRIRYLRRISTLRLPHKG